VAKPCPQQDKTLITGVGGMAEKEVPCLRGLCVAAMDFSRWAAGRWGESQLFLSSAWCGHREVFPAWGEVAAWLCRVEETDSSDQRSEKCLNVARSLCIFLQC